MPHTQIVSKKRNNLAWFILPCVIIALDQFTKYLAVHALTPYQPHAVLPFFNLTLMFNKGAAWSFLSHSGNLATWLFSCIGLIVSLVIIVWLYRLPVSKRWQACALALILGGALSNVIDRLMIGHVIDFLDFYYRSWHFAAFNVADSAITIGAVMWFIELFFQG